MTTKPRTQWTQDVNWTYIRRSEDVQDVFWTSYVRSIYVCLFGLCVLRISLILPNKKRKRMGFVGGNVSSATQNINKWAEKCDLYLVKYCAVIAHLVLVISKVFGCCFDHILKFGCCFDHILNLELQLFTNVYSQYTRNHSKLLLKIGTLQRSIRWTPLIFLKIFQGNA